MQTEVKYTISTGDVNIAYMVLGNAERDLVLVSGWIFHLEVVWEHPTFEAFMARLLRNFRVILFDKRGTGLSDRIGASSMEERMDDVRAVMDAVESERATIMGWSEGGNIAALFAATHPERVDGLVLYASSARYKQADDYPLGYSDAWIDAGRHILMEAWGSGAFAFVAAPSRFENEEFRKWFGRYERHSVSPGQGLEMMELNLQIDTRAVLRQLRVPTLVLHNRGDALVPLDASRYIADLVPGARLVELEGDDHLFWFSNSDDVVGEIEDFVLGTRFEPISDRVLSTVLFTDIVGSTERAKSMGDGPWSELLDAYERLAKREVDRFRGRLIKSTGDGILATFDGPGRAIRCALRMCDAVTDLGIQIRAGVHTGEIEVSAGDISGIAVHVAARVAALAERDEVLASRTVRDLAAGAGICFTDRGLHELRGTDESWRLFATSV